ncbi:hypothetical protein HYY75_07075 [bacterium]|nr:hypothetical protein [bacterium]
MKRCFFLSKINGFLFVFFLTIVTSFGQESIFVDTRLMLLSHPIVRSFDSQTRRFAGTSSEFVLGGEKGVFEVENEIKSIETKILSLTEVYKPLFSRATSLNRKSLESKFLQEKRSLESRLATLRKRIDPNMGVPERPGLTSGLAIIPQVNSIASDLRAVINRLKLKYQPPVILDIASLLPACIFPVDKVVLSKNRHFEAWRQNFSNREGLFQWLNEAKTYWVNSGTGISPIPFGAQDVRLEAIQMIEQFSKGKN